MCNGNCNKCGVVNKHPHDEEIAKLERLWKRLAEKETKLQEEFDKVVDRRRLLEEEVYDLERNN